MFFGKRMEIYPAHNKAKSTRNPSEDIEVEHSRAVLCYGLDDGRRQAVSIQKFYI